MRLSAERYEQVLARLKSDSRVGSERRNEPRVGLAGEAPLVSVAESGKRIADTVRVRDFSRGGVGLIIGQFIPARQRFMLQLQYENGQPLWLVCRTTHCRPIDGGRFVVGARVEKQLRSGQIQQAEQKQKAQRKNSAEPLLATGAAGSKEADIARIAKAILG